MSKIFWSWLYGQSLPFVHDFLTKWKWQGILDLSFGLADLELDLPFFPFLFACCFGCGEGRTGAPFGLGVAFGFGSALAFGFPFGAGAAALGSGCPASVAVAEGLPDAAKSQAYLSLAAMFLSS